VVIVSHICFFSFSAFFLKLNWHRLTHCLSLRDKENNEFLLICVHSISHLFFFHFLLFLKLNWHRLSHYLSLILSLIKKIVRFFLSREWYHIIDQILGFLYALIHVYGERVLCKICLIYKLTPYKINIQNWFIMW